MQVFLPTDDLPMGVAEEVGGGLPAGSANPRRLGRVVAREGGSPRVGSAGARSGRFQRDQRCAARRQLQRECAGGAGEAR